MNETIKGRVWGIESKDGGWMEATILQANGQKQKVSTKDLKRWGDLKVGLYIKADCSRNERPNPRGGNPFVNYYINSWMEDGDAVPAGSINIIEGPDGEPVGIPAFTPKDDPWPGKDRAIAMESAYHSAALFFQHRLTFPVDEMGGARTEYPYTTDHLHTLAMEMYTAIEKARAGE